MWIGPHANDLLIVVYDLDIVNHRPDFFLLFHVGLQLVCVESLCEHLCKVSAVYNRRLRPSLVGGGRGGCWALQRFGESIIFSGARVEHDDWAAVAVYAFTRSVRFHLH